MTTKANKTKTTPDTLESVCDAFVERIETALYARLNNEADVDVDTAANDLTEAFAAAGVDPAPILQIGRAAVERLETGIKSTGLHEMNVGRALLVLLAVPAALDELLTSSSDVETARADLAGVKTEREEALADLEKLVLEAAPVEQIATVRTRIEVDLPARIEAAELALADAELAVAAARRPAAQTRLEARETHHEKLTADVQRLTDELKAAEHRADRHVRRVHAARRAVAEADTAHERATTAKTALQARIDADRRRRVRRLAGLPDEPPATPQRSEQPLRRVVPREIPDWLGSAS